MMTQKIQKTIILFFIIMGAVWSLGQPLGFAGNSQKKATVAQRPEDVKPLQVGDKIPAVTLTNADDLQVPLEKIIPNQPTVLIFYRGGWCVYCNRHLGQLKTIEEDLRKLGFQIIAVSPDSVEKLRESLKKHQMHYLLLSDSSGEAMKKFGLAFRLDDTTYQRYKNQYKIDIEKDSGQNHHLLPVPAAFLVDQKGIIRYRYVNPDYKVRVDPQELLNEAQKLSKK